jgi:hypothetical protein
LAPRGARLRRALRDAARGGGARHPASLANDDLARFMREPVDFDNLIAVLSGLPAARDGAWRLAARARGKAMMPAPTATPSK